MIQLRFRFVHAAIEAANGNGPDYTQEGVS